MKKFIFYVVCFLPNLALAIPLRNLDDVGAGFYSMLFYLIPVVIGFALFAFLWGILTYLWHNDNEEKREESKKFMFWGLVGLFVIVSIWGLVSILSNIFNIPLSARLAPVLPRVGQSNVGQ